MFSLQQNWRKRGQNRFWKERWEGERGSNNVYTLVNVKTIK
jgi:hypothetical protein